MVERRAIILAAGEATRWDGEGIKQLVEVDGMPLLERTLKQLDKHHCDIVIMGNERLAQFAKCRTPEVTCCTTDTLLRSYETWGQRNYVILGDVYFTNAAMDQMFRCTKRFCVFTDTVDIFALTFTSFVIPQMEEAIKRTVNEAARTGGRIHELYREWHQVPRGTKCPWISGTYQTLGDETQDFDCLKDLEQFRAGHTKNHILRRKQINEAAALR